MIVLENSHQLGDCGPVAEPAARRRLDQLTTKQRQVLDLLIEHKTSKEIARDLGISPHTVDQRITLARIKLGLSSRSGIAQEYRRLRNLCERGAYQESHVGIGDGTFESSLWDDPESLLIDTDDMRFRGPVPAPLAPDAVPESEVRVVPELFDGPLGTMIRLGAIGGVAILVELVALLGIGLFVLASRLL